MFLSFTELDYSLKFVSAVVVALLPEPLVMNVYNSALIRLGSRVALYGLRITSQPDIDFDVKIHQECPD